MVFLSVPDERRLWVVIGAILGVSALLVLASLQFPWFTAGYFVGTSEFRGEFDFEDATLTRFANGGEGRTQTLVYGDDSPFGNLMGQVQVLVGIGIVGILAFVALLGLYYYGMNVEAWWIKTAWIVGFVAMMIGIAWFALRAGQAGSDEVVALLDSHPDIPPNALGAPEPMFWGTQPYANGDLATSPGVGWLLAILAVLNLVVGTLLLYRFPSPGEDPSEDDGYDVDEDAPAMESVEVDSARLS